MFARSHDEQARDCRETLFIGFLLVASRSEQLHVLCVVHSRNDSSYNLKRIERDETKSVSHFTAVAFMLQHKFCLFMMNDFLLRIVMTEAASLSQRCCCGEIVLNVNFIS